MFVVVPRWRRDPVGYWYTVMRQKRHDRKTHGPLAANNHAGGYGGSLGRAPAQGCAGQSIGKNDAAASRISGHAERHLQLRNLHAVRAAEFLQGGRTATSARTAGAKPSRSRIDFTLPWRDPGGGGSTRSGGVG